MKRWIPAALVLLCLGAGCSSTVDLQEELNTKLDMVRDEPAHAPDHYKTYYSYYIEPAVGRFAGDHTSNIFAYEGQRIILNIDTASIINADYRGSSQTAGDSFQEGAQTASSSGSYTDHTGKRHYYQLRVYANGSGDFLVMHTDTAYLYARCRRSAVSDVAAEMLKIVRSLSVDSDKVRRDLSSQVNEERFSYDGDRFTRRTPTNGKISDIIESDRQDDEMKQNGDQQAQSSASPDGDK